MTSISSVLVGVDGTADGERAVEYGAALAEREDLDLLLVHVVDEYAVFGPEPFMPAISALEIGESVLRDAVRHVEKVGFDVERARSVLAEGPRASALVREAARAEHIVLGTRSSAIAHLFTGATSLSVVARSALPVHCVPRAWSDASEPTGQIAVGVDGSEADSSVLASAFAEAATRDARLEIVHAWRPVSPYDVSINGRVRRDDWEKATRRRLTTRIESVAADHVGVSWVLRLEYERVPVALHAGALNADLLMLGKHGHRAPLALVGSHTRAMLRHAVCPVVVIPVDPLRA